MLQPTVRRTWAPVGETPIHYSWDRRDRLSAISAITVSPQRRRLGLSFDVLDHNVTADDFEWFVERLLRKLQRPLILVLDRYQVHRSAAKRLGARFGSRVGIEWLPPYAPELNPDEQVWKRSKRDKLANFIPDDVWHLGYTLVDTLREIRGEQAMLRSFFDHAGLSL